MVATSPSIAPELTLPPAATTWGKLRSSVLRHVAARALPQSFMFFHGARMGPKRVALTFDDGPDEGTVRYLELLERLNVRATFFVIGDRAERRPDAVREILAAGHELAGHGFTHRQFPELSAAELVAELLRTAEALPLTTTRHPLVRPPKGAVNPRSLGRTAAAGFTSVMWSLDSDDCRTTDPARVASAVSPSRVKPGEVVLMHEGQEWTLEALPRIVGELRSAGYELVTVGELMENL